MNLRNPLQPRRRHWLVWLRRCGAAFLLLIAAGAITWMLLPKPELYPEGMTFSRQVFDADGKLIHLSLTPDGKYRLPANLDGIAPMAIRATIEKEDRRYYSHAGVDLRAVTRAAWGIVSGQRLGGGSTLTMQYARVRWGMNTRSWWGKAVQAFRGLQFERHYGKRELLEAYLTLASYGGNVEGISAASLVWCGKPAAELSDREAIALCVLPQSPTQRRPRAGQNTQLAAAQARLLEQLRGEISEADAHFTLSPTVIPRQAPHLSRRLFATSPEAMDVRSTIHSAQQSEVERTITDFLSRWNDRGLNNAGAILVHAPTREVRAYVGSARFLDDEISGQVDAVTARRSPGSTLKPFIYALALDAGLIHPFTLLDDAPRQFGGYDPENSDRSYLGPIPAAEALRRSRNVPAVELLGQLPNGGLDQFLRASGAKLTRPAGEYGLSLALGGAELSLEELAMLYAALASDGTPQLLRFTRATHFKTSARRLLSPAACWLTLEALRGGAANAPRALAWKTGTSHGFRDAWACGAIGDHVLCVWIGHFDGKPMPGLFARDTAAPLLFDLVTRLALPTTPAQPQPSDVVMARMCSDSGMIAAPCCPHSRMGSFIAGVSPIAVCDVHREVYLNAHGLRVSAGNPSGRVSVREFWPPHRLEQFRRAGLPRQTPPEWANGETESPGSRPPQIISPQSALTYVLQSSDLDKRSIPLRARTAPGVQRIHWFAGAQYIGSAPPSQPVLWSPPPGRWTIRATDDAGHVASVAVTVTGAVN